MSLGHRMVKAWPRSSYDSPFAFGSHTPGKTIHILKGHTKEVCDVAWSSDGQLLVLYSSDNQIKVWNATNGAFLQNLEGHTDYVDSCWRGRPIITILQQLPGIGPSAFGKCQVARPYEFWKDTTDTFSV